MKIVTISDTHGMHRSLNMPDGDVLIHAGDFSTHGTLDNAVEFNQWLGTLDYKHKLIIAGNHELCFEKNPEEAEKVITNATYLKDSIIVIDDIKFYGSPWQPRFYNWAFNLDRGGEIKEKWDLIDNDVDVLITHGPPYGHLDMTMGNEHVGCEELLKAIHRVKPKLHVFGHIHCGYGMDKVGSTRLINACSCTERYEPSNQPFVVEI